MRGATRKEWLGVGGMLLCCASIVAWPSLAESPAIKRLVPLSAADQKLIGAVKADDLQAVKIALDEGADINCQDRARFRSCTEVLPRTYYTPVAVAVVVAHSDRFRRRGALNNYRVLKFLLQHGADPNLSGNYGNTPLGLSVRNLVLYEEGGEAVDLLLQYGAKPSGTLKQRLEIAREKMESKGSQK